MRIARLIFALAALAAVVAVSCSPAGSTPAATSGEPGASELPTLHVPRPSGKNLPTRTIEIPPPID
jgi:hypothetical protein